MSKKKTLKPMTVRRILYVLLSDLDPKFRKVRTNVVELAVEPYESRKVMKFRVVADLGLVGNWTVETLIARLVDLGSARLDYNTSLGSMTCNRKRVEFANLFGYTQASDIEGTGSRPPQSGR